MRRASRMRRASVMPSDDLHAADYAPLKVDATKAYGADVVLYGDVFDEAAAHAAELAPRKHDLCAAL